MEIRHLKTFVAIAEELHFARAARRLFVDPSAMSRTLKALEEEMQVPLVARSRHEVTLTAAGRDFLDKARRILEDTDRAVENAREIARGKKGRLTVGLAGHAALSQVPQVLRMLRHDHPEMYLRLTPISSRAQPAALRDGRCDIALTAMPLQEPDLQVIPLLTESLMLLVSEDHTLSTQDAVRFTELAHEVHVLLPKAAEPVLYNAFRSAFVDSPPSRSIIEAPDLGILLALVAANEGVSYVPSSMRKLHYEGVVLRPLEPRYEVRLFALYPRKTNSPFTQSFLEAFTAVSQEETQT